jgi:hypothetical protein
MTATVDPGEVGKMLHRKDPEVRLRDYEEALRFWVNYPDKRIKGIVFAENSGYPLIGLGPAIADAKVVGREVEVVQTNDNHIPPGFHYGYSEMRLIATAIGRSRLLAESDYFIKATGRLRFPGVSRLLDRLPDEFDFAVDARSGINIRGWKRAPFVSTVLMVFKTVFYKKHLSNAHESMVAGSSHIESIIYKTLLCHEGRSGAVLRWPVSVEPVGRAAHWNKRYDSFFGRGKSAFRSMCRLLAPNWWI